MPGRTGTEGAKLRREDKRMLMGKSLNRWAQNPTSLADDPIGAERSRNWKSAEEIKRAARKAKLRAAREARSNFGASKPRRTARKIGKKFFMSDAWRTLRYEAFKRYGRQCLVCGRGRSHGVVLHVDHIKPRSKFPELALEITNLQILCEDCNLGKSNTDQTDWR